MSSPNLNVSEFKMEKKTNQLHLKRNIIGKFSKKNKCKNFGKNVQISIVVIKKTLLTFCTAVDFFMDLIASKTTMNITYEKTQIWLAQTDRKIFARQNFVIVEFFGGCVGSIAGCVTYKSKTSITFWISIRHFQT